MSKTNQFVFKALLIIAWIIFVALCIEAGGLVVNFIFSLYWPDFVQHLYQKLDLSQLYDINWYAFLTSYSFIITIALLKAALFYTVIRLMHQLNLAQPFSTFAAKQITLISQYTLAIGLISFIARQTTKKWDSYDINTENLHQFWADSDAYILMGAVVYIIACIFKKGVEIQNENELTV